MDTSLKQNLTSQEKWIRFFFMVVFFVINYFVQIFVGILALFQFITTLIKGNPNERVLVLGDSVSQFVYQIMSYLTYSTDERPYPFSEWPASKHHFQKSHSAGSSSKSSSSKKTKTKDNSEE
jgi:cytoskeletal protein RodZ